MTEQTAGAQTQFEGKMFLYEQPELLTVEDHGSLGLSTADRPFEFVRQIRAVPLVSVEFSSAQKDYPIIFTNDEIPSPLAMLGVVEDDNLFVDEEGNWERGRYIPTYIRCHPIAFAKGPNEQLAIVIDRSSPAVTENPEEPFFADGKLSEQMQKHVDFCARYNAERNRTAEFCQKLKELDLFVGQQVRHRPQGGEESPIGQYVAIDLEKLGNVDRDILGEWHRNGFLASLYAHAFSLENWSRVLDRRERRHGKAADTTA